MSDHLNVPYEAGHAEELQEETDARNRRAMVLVVLDYAHRRGDAVVLTDLIDALDLGAELETVVDDDVFRQRLIEQARAVSIARDSDGKTP